MSKRVVVTGMAGISPIGNDWLTVFERLKSQQNGIKKMLEWQEYEGLYTQLGAPVEFTVDAEYFNRKRTRSMGRVSLLAACVTQKALQDAHLFEDGWIKNGDVGVAYGSSAGSFDAILDLAKMFDYKNTRTFSANTYIKMMGHTAPVNLAIFFGITGRIITTSSACTSASQGIGYAYETIRNGYQLAMVAGGSEELSAADAAVFDTLFAASVKNDAPETTPSPFDAKRDGLVLGEGAGTLILEEYEHAKARGATIYAELVGFGTNSDGTHVTKPNAKTMQRAIELALEDAHLSPFQIGYINAHGTGTEHGDIAESEATYAVFGDQVPISSLKSYTGHTLGACGALEAWMSIEMMRNNWFAPTINLEEVDSRCAPLDYIMQEARKKDCEYVMSNNFAFGGINTSLIFKRMM